MSYWQGIGYGYDSFCRRKATCNWGGKNLTSCWDAQSNAIILLVAVQTSPFPGEKLTISWSQCYAVVNLPAPNSARYKGRAENETISVILMDNGFTHTFFYVSQTRCVFFFSTKNAEDPCKLELGEGLLPCKTLQHERLSQPLCF